MELNRVLDKVRKLIAKAEGTDNEAEAEAYREQADALMLKYAIDEATARQARPAASTTPAKIEVELAGGDLSGYAAKLARDVAKHCRCLIREYARYDYERHCYMARVYGWESDLRYFEIMYTTLRLQMIGSLAPKFDPSRSLGENAYVLRAAGFNWTEITSASGIPDWKPGHAERRAEVVREYKKEIRRQGEAFVKIPAGRASEAFRRDASYGYVTRIEQRLRALRERQESAGYGGAALVLVSAATDLAAFFRADNEDLFAERAPSRYEPCPKCAKNKSGTCRDHPAGRAYRPAPFSEAGYAAGVRQANAATLDPAAGGGSTPALPR